MTNLFHKKIVDNDVCPICQRFLESTGYILWDCASARNVWSQSCKKIQKLSISYDYFLDIQSTLYSMLSREELDEVAYTFSLIWQRRNEYIFHHKFRHPNSIILNAKSELNCYSQSLQLSTPRQPTKLAKWQKNSHQIFTK